MFHVEVQVYSEQGADNVIPSGDSLEDLRRELDVMMKGDKHERLMEAWAKQMIHEAATRQKEIEEARKKRGVTEAGVYQQATIILTEKEIKERQAALAKGRSRSPRRSRRAAPTR